MPWRWLPRRPDRRWLAARGWTAGPSRAARTGPARVRHLEHAQSAVLVHELHVVAPGQAFTAVARRPPGDSARADGKVLNVELADQAPGRLGILVVDQPVESSPALLVVQLAGLHEGRDAEQQPGAIVAVRPRHELHVPVVGDHRVGGGVRL